MLMFFFFLCVILFNFACFALPCRAVPYPALAWLGLAVCVLFNGWKLASSVSNTLWMCVFHLTPSTYIYHLYTFFLFFFCSRAWLLFLFFLLCLVAGTIQPLTLSPGRLYTAKSENLLKTLCKSQAWIKRTHAHTHIHSHLCVQCIKLEFMNCWKPNHIRRYEDILLMCFFRFPFCLSLSLAPMEITKRNIFFPHLWWDGFLISWQMKWEDI